MLTATRARSAPSSPCSKRIWPNGALLHSASSARCSCRFTKTQTRSAQRQGEVISGENRAWTANAAACVLATGLAQVSWILAELRDTSPGLTAYLDWSAFASAGAGLFLWEAFVTGEAKRRTHGEDAVAAVEAFREALPTPMGFDAVEAERPLSLIGAALLWSGWATDLEMLSTSCLVIKPRARDAEHAAAKAR